MLGVLSGAGPMMPSRAIARVACGDGVEPWLGRRVVATTKGATGGYADYAVVDERFAYALYPGALLILLEVILAGTFLRRLP